MNIFSKVVFLIVNTSCSRGLVWFNICVCGCDSSTLVFFLLFLCSAAGWSGSTSAKTTREAGGMRRSPMQSRFQTIKQFLFHSDVWDDCYGDHLHHINVGRSWNWTHHRHLVKVVTNQEELINRLEEPCRGAAEAMLCHYAFPGLWCRPVIITIIITTILFLQIFLLFSLRLCYSLRRRCRSSPLLRGLCCSQTAG